MHYVDKPKPVPQRGRNWTRNGGRDWTRFDTLIDIYCTSYARPPREVTLDIDDTVDVVHGHQQLSLFNSHYDERCFQPIHVYETATSRPVAVLLRSGKTPSGREVRGQIRRLVRRIRTHWPRTKLTIRGDSHYGRQEAMAWCEANGVDFLFGLQKNDRLVAEIANQLAQAEAKSRRTGKPARYFKEFKWRTRRSWSRERRVVGKAEFTTDEANPRFVVTSLERAECRPKYLYEKLYCARGEMENRIKECQLDLYADRTSTATMRANQLRLWLASFAYVLLCAVRRIGLHHTPFANASCGTIRLKLLKIGALVRVSVRRIKIAMASSCPAAAVWGCAAVRLNAAASARGSPA